MLFFPHNCPLKIHNVVIDCLQRARRDRSRERTPARDERPRATKTPPRAAAAATAAAPDAGKDKDAEMLSGSEEGEIEE